MVGSTPPTRTSSGLDGRTFALVEAGARPVELSYELDTIAHCDFSGTLPNGYTAHPKVDPATGDLHAIAYHWAIPHLQYVVVGPDARVRQVEPIEVTDGPMVHDCSITERWMVVYDFPVTFDIDAAMSRHQLPVRLERGPRLPASGSFRSAGRGATCDGSKSSRATRSIRSMPSTMVIVS